MKKSFGTLIIALIAVSRLGAQDPWVVVNPQMRTLNCVTFSSFNYGCAVGAMGTVLNTEDNGNTWNIRNSGTTDDLNCVVFTDGQEGFAAGINGTILKTMTAGNGWAPLTSGTNYPLFAVDFVAGYGVVGGINSTFLKTTNGLDFTNQWSEVNCHVSSICFPTATTGYAACADGILMKTTNSGAQWYKANTGFVTEHLTSVYFPTPLVGYVVGLNGLIMKTDDAWTSSFLMQSSGVSEALNSVYFTDELNGYAVGNSGTIIKTSDGGENWVNISYGTRHYKSVFFVTAEVGFIVGQDGIMMKTTTGGLSVEEWKRDLVNVFPNPANDVLNINLRGHKANALEIYDIGGKSVMRKEAPLPAIISISGLPAGIYQLLIRLDDGIFSTRIIKV